MPEIKPEDIERAQKAMEKKATQTTMPMQLPFQDEEEFVPTSVRQLFDESQDLTLKTEIPRGMIMTMLRLRIIQAAMDPRRTTPLIEILQEEYKRLMVSVDRKGRDELLRALTAMGNTGTEEEEVLGIG